MSAETLMDTCPVFYGWCSECNWWGSEQLDEVCADLEVEVHNLLDHGDE